MLVLKRRVALTPDRGTFEKHRAMYIMSTLLLHYEQDKSLGRHLCRTKLPRKVFNSETRMLRDLQQKRMKSSKNAPERPRKMLSPVQLPKSFSLAIFRTFASTISNTVSNITSSLLTTRICRGGHADKS